MKNKITSILLSLLSLSLVIADNYLYLDSIDDDGAGNVSFTLGYNFDVEVAGFQFDLLTDGFFILNSADGGACTDSGFTVSTNASGRVIGFNLTGATISAGMGDFITLSGTYDTAFAGTVVSVTAIEDCESDGDAACDSDDTRMVLSDTGAAPVSYTHLTLPTKA